MTFRTLSIEIKFFGIKERLKSLLRLNLRWENLALFLTRKDNYILSLENKPVLTGFSDRSQQQIQ